MAARQSIDAVSGRFGFPRFGSRGIVQKAQVGASIYVDGVAKAIRHGLFAFLPFCLLFSLA